MLLPLLVGLVDHKNTHKDQRAAADLECRDRLSEQEHRGDGGEHGLGEERRRDDRGGNSSERVIDRQVSADLGQETGTQNT